MPFHKSPPGQYLAYQFRVRPTGSAQQRRSVLDDPVLNEQLFLANQLRNALIAIEHEHEAALKALWSTDPDVAAAEENLARADLRVLNLEKQAKQERRLDRTTVTPASTAEEITEARQLRRAAAAARRNALAAARPAMKPRERELESERQARIKGCYAEFSQRRGLYWATFHKIREHHLTTAKLILGARAQGRPGEFRFKRWDGTGTVAVQLQREAKNPPRTPELLASGEGRWRNVLRFGFWMDPEQWEKLPVSERRRTARTHIVWCLGSGRLITLPVEASRMLPADADVTSADLTVRRVGTRREAVINVIARLPEPPPREEHPMVAVHMGWRRLPDGAVRVATWACTDVLERPSNLPQHIRDMVHLHPGGRLGEVTFPAQWLDEIEHCRSIQSQRAKELKRIVEHVAGWFDEYPQPDPDAENSDVVISGPTARSWRSARRWARLAVHWRNNMPTAPGGPAVAATLEEWRQQDKLMYEREVAILRKVRRRRDDAYRAIASWLTARAGRVVVDDTNFKRLLRHRDIADDRPAIMPEGQESAARSRARWVSPGILRTTIAAIGRRKGAITVEVDAAHLTRQHVRCGHIGDGDLDQAASATVSCLGCGESYDQDHNAVTLMLRRTQEQPMIANDSAG